VRLLFCCCVPPLHLANTMDLDMKGTQEERVGCHCARR
jgi:hypothetical protein